MSGYGFVANEQDDAADNVWLQGEFGPDVAIPTSQHADGRDERIKVYRLDEPLSKLGEEQRAELWTRLQGLETRHADSFSMVRGGNVILVVEQ